MWCALTATSTGQSSFSGRSAGFIAGTLTVKLSTGPVISRPRSLIAGDHFRIRVADGNFVSVAGQSGRDRTADGTAAEHEVAHGAKCYNTVKAAAIPKIPYLQNAS